MSEHEAVAQSAKGSDIGLAAMKFPHSLKEHLDYMDLVGIQTAILTPSIKAEWHNNMDPQGTPILSSVSLWAEGLYHNIIVWKELCERTLKAQLHEVASNPLRFGCFALLPLPYIQESLEFIRQAYSGDGLHPDGFGLTTSMG